MSWFVLLARLFCAGLVCVFAYLPLLICFTSAGVVLHDPSKLDFTSIAIFSGSAAVACFLLLIAFRAATGRGRARDGGLLPPLVMKGILALFLLVGVAILGMGLWNRELAPILGGALYLLVSFQAWPRSGQRPMNERRRI